MALTFRQASLESARLARQNASAEASAPPAGKEEGAAVKRRKSSAASKEEPPAAGREQEEPPAGSKERKVNLTGRESAAAPPARKAEEPQPVAPLQRSESSASATSRGSKGSKSKARTSLASRSSSSPVPEVGEQPPVRLLPAFLAAEQAAVFKGLVVGTDLAWLRSLEAVCELDSRKGKEVLAAVDECVARDEWSHATSSAAPNSSWSAAAWRALLAAVRACLQDVINEMRDRDCKPGFQTRSAGRAKALVAEAVGLTLGFCMSLAGALGTATPSAEEQARGRALAELAQRSLRESNDESLFQGIVSSEADNLAIASPLLRDMLGPDAQSRAALLPLAQPDLYSFENVLLAVGMARGAEIARAGGEAPAINPSSTAKAPAARTKSPATAPKQPTSAPVTAPKETAAAPVAAPKEPAAAPVTAQQPVTAAVTATKEQPAEPPTTKSPPAHEPVLAPTSDPAPPPAPAPAPAPAVNDDVEVSPVIEEDPKPSKDSREGNKGSSSKHASSAEPAPGLEPASSVKAGKATPHKSGKEGGKKEGLSDDSKETGDNVKSGKREENGSKTASTAAGSGVINGSASTRGAATTLYGSTAFGSAAAPAPAPAAAASTPTKTSGTTRPLQNAVGSEQASGEPGSRKQPQVGTQAGKAPADLLVKSSSSNSFVSPSPVASVAASSVKLPSAPPGVAASSSGPSYRGKEVPLSELLMQRVAAIVAHARDVDLLRPTMSLPSSPLVGGPAPGATLKDDGNGWIRLEQTIEAHPQGPDRQWVILRTVPTLPADLDWESKGEAWWGVQRCSLANLKDNDSSEDEA
jgi:hypothetical protein